MVVSWGTHGAADNSLGMELRAPTPWEVLCFWGSPSNPPVCSSSASKPLAHNQAPVSLLLEGNKPVNK